MRSGKKPSSDGPGLIEAFRARISADSIKIHSNGGTEKTRSTALVSGAYATNINTREHDSNNEEKMTAPEGAGPLRRVRPDHSLWNVDDDHGLVGHDRQPYAVHPTADVDHKDHLTSHRDGSGLAERLVVHGEPGLPVYRHPSPCGSCEINISGFRITMTYRIPCGNVKKNNGASEVQILRIGLPKIPHGLSSFSISFLSLAKASSIPCDQLANSCSCTPLSRNSKRSCEIVMFRDFLLRFVTTIRNKILHKQLNKTQINLCTAKITFAGRPKHDKNNSYSDSYAKPGDHGQGHHHGMSGEQRGTRPRLRLGPPSVHGEEGGAGGHAGGLRPPALAGPLGSGLRLSGVSA